MSATPIHLRYDDLSHVAVALWRERLGEHLCEAIRGVIAAAHSPNRDEDLPSALNPLLHPRRDLIAAMDLLLAAHFDPVIAEPVFSDQRGCLQPFCVPSASLTRTQAAQSAYVASLAYGLIMMWQRAEVVPVDISGPVADVCRALADPAKPVRLPSVSPDDISPLAMQTDDSVLDDLHAATLEEVGRHGYRGATMQRIGANAQVSQGFIFGRYSTKRELFVDATARRHKAAFDSTAAHLADLQKRRGMGVAEATVIKTLMQPGIEVQRAVQLEQYRLGWYDPSLGAELDKAMSQYLEQSWSQVSETVGESVAAQQHLDLALGIGATVLPALLPDAWELPFDVVTVPLLG